MDASAFAISLLLATAASGVLAIRALLAPRRR